MFHSPKILIYVIEFLVILFAISIHESAHAWMANKLGDPTAKNLGRVTLNPIPHIDLVGTIIFPAMLIIFSVISGTAPIVFGWAKPVPVNPYNLRNPRRDGMLVSAAGPVSNLLTATVGIIIFNILKKMGIVNLAYGGRVPLLTDILFLLILFSVVLMIFNLIPIPPLDGSGILEGLLKGEALETYHKIRPFGFIILLVVLYTGVLDLIFNPIFRIIVLLIR